MWVRIDKHILGRIGGYYKVGHIYEAKYYGDMTEKERRCSTLYPNNFNRNSIFVAPVKGLNAWVHFRRDECTILHKSTLLVKMKIDIKEVQLEKDRIYRAMYVRDMSKYQLSNSFGVPANTKISQLLDTDLMIEPRLGSHVWRWCSLDNCIIISKKKRGGDQNEKV